MPNQTNETVWAMACHLAALLGYLIPLGNIIGPFAIWAFKKDDSEYINSQGKEAINFQITMFLAFLVALLLAFALIGFVLIPLVAIFDLIFIIIAAVKARNGEAFRYPVSIRFVK